MGRPLNKKYFGFWNTGSTGTGDNGIGGLSVASVTIDTAGSYTTRPTVTFSDPDLAGLGGVTATGTVTMEASSATVNNGGANYQVGDLLTITGAGGAVAYVASVDAGNSDAVLTVNFTGTGAVRGEQTSLTGITSGVATTGGSGDGNATLDVAYRVKAIVITEAGSGYTDATDAAVTFSAGAAAGTTVLTTRTGRQNPAIIATAHTGGNDKAADIVKQVSSKRYRVETEDGQSVAKLTDSTPNAAGEMSIVATDSAGGTYFVTKLTARKAVLVPGTGTQFASGASVPWTFGSAVLNTSVKIPNS